MTFLAPHGTREPARVKFVRKCLQNWPLPRGKGILLKAFRPLLRARSFVFELEPGIVVPGELDDYMFLHFFVHGMRLDSSFALARGLTRPGDTVLDVGANLGFWLMGVARIAGAEATVHAFEPLPLNVDRLGRHLRMNGLEWVKCHACAVGAEVGEATFRPPMGCNSGVGSLSVTAERGDLTVRVTTLDRFCSEHELNRVDLLKVDVEGAELLVVKGAEALLNSARAPVVMFEVGDELAARFGNTSADVKKAFAERGYLVYRFRRGRLILVDTREAHPSSEDLFALRPSHFDERPALGRFRGRIPGTRANARAVHRRSRGPSGGPSLLRRSL